MLSPAAVLGLLAVSVLSWPAGLAAKRLERALRAIEAGVPSEGRADRRAMPRLPRSRGLRVLLCLAAVIVLSQFVAPALAVTVVAVGVTAGRSVARLRAGRATADEEQAALEGLGILVAELRAGRAADDALATAGRHCGHPGVEALLRRLGRTLRLGGPLGEPNGLGRPLWQARLIAGIRLTSETGCALADVIAAVESDLSGLAHRRSELRASAAGHRATVALLAGLPILGLAMGAGIGAEPIDILTATPIGHVLLLIGIALELLGLTWSRRLADRALRHG